MNAEGWYVDPYGLHGARWFSDGTPTALVRQRPGRLARPAAGRPVRGPAATGGRGRPGRR